MYIFFAHLALTANVRALSIPLDDDVALASALVSADWVRQQ